MTAPTQPNRRDYVRATGRQESQNEPRKQLQAVPVLTIIAIALSGGALVAVAAAVMLALR